MYTEFFNLKCKPFELVPDPEFLMLSRGHKRALVHLNYGIAENAGFILVTGEVGTGKTTVIRKIMKEMRSDILLSRINNTRINSDQLMSMINEDFGLEVKGKSKTEMLSDLTTFLIDEYAKGRRATLIIDEAQNLSADLLEEIRLLSNLETDKAKLLQIILVGQPELLTLLARPELRQLRQRISISCHIQPLSRDETEHYIFHRFEIAGNRNALTFDEGVIDAIYRFSRGIPRLINIACDFLLLSAFAEETKKITAELVSEVIGEIEKAHGYWHDEVTEELPAPEGQTSPLTEIYERLDKLETSHNGGTIPREEWEYVATKLVDIEKRLDKLAAPDKKVMGSMHAKAIHDELSRIQKELDLFHRRLVGLENRVVTVETNKVKKGLWRRLSGRDR